MKRIFKLLTYISVVIVTIISLLVLYVMFILPPGLPHVADKSVRALNRSKSGGDSYTIGPNWLRKNKDGLYEEYIEGEPFERGVITGKLNKELLYKQEVCFVDRLRSLVPNQTYLRGLDLFARIFNRHLVDNIALENQLEIYGESLSAPDEFDFIAPPYERMLNYHAAHDIGHMMQNFALVGCTSFAVWNSKTTDSGMLIGRNCDFYAGDKFAEDKLIYFCNPKQGNKFVMITWGGMMGCLSGMNNKGLTVTINAAKSDLPTGSATPISILSREILQYAGNIDEAYAIAKKRKTFVAEAIMIGSAADHKTVIIEKSPTKTALYFSDKDYILCTNHFQSDTFSNDKNNLENIAVSASMYRYKRLEELVLDTTKFNYSSVATVLRDLKGLHGKNIGVGNEKSINQLICHHSVIFQPEKLKFWVSTQPYQLGKYVCYDLGKIFGTPALPKEGDALNDTSFTIPADTFIYTSGWLNFLKYKAFKTQIEAAVLNKQPLPDEGTVEREFVQANPEYWETYDWLGQYFRSRKDKTKALKYYRSALTKEINDKLEEAEINKSINELNSKQ